MSKCFSEGMGRAVAERTILRKKDNGEWEDWSDVAKRVALGNTLLSPIDQKSEYKILHKHLDNATIIMSGRHLQHGDETQPNRPQEVFTNCSTSCTSFSMFLLLMSGSGVGRCYDDDMMLVDWENAPNLRCVLDSSHPDFDYSAHESVRDAKHKYTGKDVLWHKVGDSREGWAKALEVWENAAFEKIHKDKLLILDFSDIRCNGSPISGMQGRPASGPVSLICAFSKAATLKGAGLPRWKQSMWVDHSFAEAVLSGGARRSARMSTKSWKDSSVIDFINVKRPIEYYGKTLEEVIEYRKTEKPFTFLWSSNNSITVDQTFWKLLAIKKGEDKYNDDLTKWARKVFNAACEAAYGDGTGEPGFINEDKLNKNNANFSDITSTFIHSKRYSIEEDTQLYLNRLIKAVKKKKNWMVVNPCSEIPLNILGGFCVIADLVPYHADSLDDCEEAFRAAARALIRVNLMDSIYSQEVKRTNRIGVGMTGVFEFAWKFFKFGFKDLIDEEKSIEFWKTLSRFKIAVQDEAKKYSEFLGVAVPHTDTTIKPSGSVSKLFAVTEGWHLPAMEWYLRWVQFSNDDPLVEVYRKNGYPTKELLTYKRTTIVGFPTSLELSHLGLGDKFITADKATPEEQYKWVMLGEKYWLRGVVDGKPLENDTGNQISYTLKYDPKVVDFKSFKKTVLEYQSKVKCCSVMPTEERSSYEYLPEQTITKAEYEGIVNSIKQEKEDIGREHIDCSSGSCPINFNEGKKE